MKRKYIIVGCLVAALLLIIAGVAVWLNLDKPEPVQETTLVGIDEEVMLGSAYKIPETVKDINQTEYKVESAAVYRVSDGKQALVIYGSFDVRDILGYTIEYVVSKDNTTAKLIQKLTVRDGLKPMITVESKQVAEVNELYAFPQITIRDNSGLDLPYSVEVFRSGETLVKVDSTEQGFTPAEVGFYELHITTADKAGNEASAVYRVYARTNRMTTELDSFDDEGLYLTTKVVSGSARSQAALSPFKRLDSSKGSASFPSGSGSATDFYVTPRNEAAIMDLTGEDGYISVWVYIATLANSTKTVSCFDVPFTVPTNEWQELKVTADMIGLWPAFFDRLASHSMPLLSIANDGEDYVVYVDDVFAVRTDIQLTIGEQPHTAAQAIPVNVSGGQNVVTEYYYAGSATPFTGAFTPEMDGAYLVCAYSADRTAMTTQKVVVGELTATPKQTQWYTVGSGYDVPLLSVTDGRRELDAACKTYQVDLATGRRTELDDTFLVDSTLVTLYSECAVNGRTVALFRIIPAHEYSFGAFYDTDDPDLAELNDQEGSLKWLEEFDGEKGVITISGSADQEQFLTLRNTLQVIYSKEHYRNCTKLVFKMRGDKDNYVRMSYIAEPSWVNMPVNVGITDEWQEYEIDFASIYEYFDEFTTKNLVWIHGGQEYTVYIADIYAVQETNIPDVQVFQNRVHNIAEVPALIGSRISSCSVTQNGKPVNLDGYSFTAKEGSYTVRVSGFDFLGLSFDYTYQVYTATPDYWTEFSTPDSCNTWAQSPVTVEWLDNYAGAQGVMKIHHPGTVADWFVTGVDGQNNYPTVFNASDFAGAEGLIFRVKIENGDSNAALAVVGRGWARMIGSPFSGNSTTDGWVEFLLPVNVAEDFDLLQGMIFSVWANGETDIYIDSIRAYRPAGETERDMWYSFSDQFCGNVWSNGPKATWLETFEGAQGVLKIENANGLFGNTENNINWEPAFDKEHYADATGLTFRVWIDSDGLNSFSAFCKDWWPQYEVYKDKGSTGGWQEFTIKVNVYEEYDSLKVMFFSLWSNSENATVYIDSIRAVMPEAEHTVTFDSGVESQIVAHRQKAKKPEDPVRENDTFLGWYYKGQLFDFSTPITGDITLIARWKNDAPLWYGFDDASSADVWTSESSIEWLREYEGAQGVLKIVVGNGGFVGSTGDKVNWEPFYKINEYADSIGLRFRIKVEGAGFHSLSVYSDTDWTPNTKLYDGQMATDGWVEFDWYVDVAAEYNALSTMFFVPWMSEEGAVIYIDSIRTIQSTGFVTVTFDSGVSPQTIRQGKCAVEPEAPTKPGYVFKGWYLDGKKFDFTTPVMSDITLTAQWELKEQPEDMWYGFDSAESAAPWTNGSTLEWLDSYAGAEGVLKITVKGEYVGSDNGVNWKPVFDAEHYAGATGLRFRMKLENAAGNNHSMTVRTPGWDPSFQIYDGQPNTDGWVEFVWNIDVQANYDQLSKLFFMPWPGAGETAVYIDCITAIMPEPEPPANMWYGFDTAESANKWSSDSTLEWLESYAGAKGVLKITVNGGYAGAAGDGINWAPVYDAAHYAGATGLSFRIKIEGADFNSLTVLGKGWAPSCVLYQDYGRTDGWVDFVWNIDVEANYEALQYIFFMPWSSGGGVIYIDSITAISDSLT